MSRILFAWELGANYGHLSRDLPVAEILRSGGHEVFFAVRDTRVAAEVLTPRGFAFIQAPITLNPLRLIRPPASYAEILMGEGWSDRVALLGRLTAWLSLTSGLSIDMLVADHAPTALLAAKVAEIPAVALGNGFEIPPPRCPLPSFRPWDQIPSERLEQSEKVVLDLLNQVLRAMNAKSMECLADLFPRRSIFATFAELDHYGERPEANYVGSIHGLESARRVPWPKGNALKVFVYLRPNQRATEIVLSTLAEGNCRAICAVPGADKRLIRKFTTSNSTVHPGPISLDRLDTSGAVAINYGGIGTMAMSMMSGMPQILIPQTVEQLLCAKRVESLGAGIVLGHGVTKESLHVALDEFRAKPEYARATEQFASKYADLTPSDAAVRAAEAIIAAYRNRHDQLPISIT